MNVIYEPNGRAREYAPLACNYYMGCVHSCKYCYAPGCMRKSSDVWNKEVRCREGYKEKFIRDVKRLHSLGDNRRVLFSFLSDPYQPIEGECRLTRWSIETANEHGVKVDILTKGVKSLILEDLSLMKRADVHLGMTLSFINDDSRKEWEPFASSVEDRLDILHRAHAMGIYTWVSMEPVIIPDEALAVVRKAHKDVSFWKVGKLNHFKRLEKSINWGKFRGEVTALFDKYKASYYIKEDLLNCEAD